MHHAPTHQFWKNKRVLLTGGAGFLGSYVHTLLKEKTPREIRIPRSNEYDLRDTHQTHECMKDIDIVIHLAAVVGGIGFNLRHPGKIYYDNVMINTNVLEEARLRGVKKIITIGSVCAYPKILPLPFTEDMLWNGYPEETNAPYGLTKRMLLTQTQTYRLEYGLHAIHIIPSNLYGPGDKSHPQYSHVIPALIIKLLRAKKQKSTGVSVWGTGNASREFLYVQDAAEAIIRASEIYDKKEPVNIGSGQEIYIHELVSSIASIIGYRGKILWNTAKPDGQPRRLLDSSRAKKEFGFTAKTKFINGLKQTISWYENEGF